MSLALASNNAPVNHPALSTLFRTRLEKLVAEQAAASTPKEQSAVSAAIFKLFLDCVDLGLGAEAQLILQQINKGQSA